MRGTVQRIINNEPIMYQCSSWNNETPIDRDIFIERGKDRHQSSSTKILRRSNTWISAIGHATTCNKYTSTEEKNVNEETGERCNKNSSWRGCTPMHTSKTHSFLPCKWICKQYIGIDTPVSSHYLFKYVFNEPYLLYNVISFQCIDAILYRYTSKAFYIVSGGKRYWKL